MTRILAGPRRRQSDWDGGVCTQLIVWDDQGFGDTLQNLGWIGDAARRVGTLRVLLRPSLLRLVSSCLPLPANCHLEVLDPDTPPWAECSAQIGFFYLPIVLKKWLPHAAPRGSYLKFPNKENFQSVQHALRGPRIGLVWSAGRHKAPQPERCARVRDVPTEAFFELALKWRQRYHATLVSVQLEGHDQQPVQGLIQAGDLAQPLRSPDWLETAEALESLDLLVSVDTSVAHLAGAFGIPTVLIPVPQRIGAGARLVINPFYESMTLLLCCPWRLVACPPGSGS